MDFRLRLTFIGALSLAACSTAPSSPQDFEGTWTYRDGLVRCEDLGASYPLEDIGGIEITASGESRLEFAATPDCRIQLELNGTLAEAVEPQACELSLRSTRNTATFSSFSLRALGDGQLQNTADGASTLVIGTTSLECQHFTFDGGLLARSETGPSSASGADH